VRSRLVPAGLGLALALAVAGVASPAAGGTLVKPRAGSFSGTETGLGAGSALSFTVTKTHKTLRAFTGEARVKPGCKGPYTGYEPPPGPMAITKSGHFTKSETTYPGPKLRITVTGRFTSPTKATGHIIVRFKNLKGCNAITPFSAKRTV
jgi:hypothetical protein